MVLFAFLVLLPRFDQTIVVTAERLEQPWRESTAAVTVLHRDDLAGASVADALQRAPGLQLIDVNPGAPPMISSRGFFGAGEVEYVQLLVDGVPQGDVESGLADWRAIPLESIDRIEILRGAGSSLFGDTALGGVVQVFRDPASTIAVSLGTFDTTRVTATFANDSLAAGATRTASDGFRAHSASEERSAHASFVHFTLDVAQRERDDPGARSAGEMERDPFGSHPLFADDREESRRIRAAFHHRGAFDATVHATDRHSEQTRTLLLAPGFADRSSRTVDTFALGANVSKTISFRATRAIAGLEAMRARLWTAAAPAAAFQRRRTSGAAFVSSEWHATPRLRIAAGARYDAIDDETIRDRALSPRLGISFDLGTTSVYAQLSRAFKAPTLDQRFDTRSIGGFTISNPALVAQRARNLELGARGSWWEIVAYQMKVDDEIDFDIRTFRYANIGRSTHRGVETMLRRGIGTFAYTWTRVEGASGRQLKNIAEHVVRAGIDIRTFADIHLEAEHSAGRWLDDDNRFPLDDATTIDLRVARTFGAITAALETTNLFDDHYAPLGFALGDAPYYYPASGRAVSLTVSWRDTR